MSSKMSDTQSSTSYRYPSDKTLIHMPIVTDFTTGESRR